MKFRLILSHIFAILFFPFTVIVIIPYFFSKLSFIIIPEVFILKITGLPLMVSGLTLFSTTLYLFIFIGRGTLAAWSPTKHLVISGLYRFTRIPMISGVLPVSVGKFFVFNSILIFIRACLFFIINNSYFITFKEPDLHKKFGKEYDDYKNNVRRYIHRRISLNKIITNYNIIISFNFCY